MYHQPVVITDQAKVCEPLWKGDLCDTNDALNALCIVDQIHRFAVTAHRDFVTKHLEPWLQLAEEELAPFCEEDDGWTSDDIAPDSLTMRKLGSRFYTSSSVPLWNELRMTAQVELSIKRNETKRLNKSQKQQLSERNTHVIDDNGDSMLTDDDISTEIDTESLGDDMEGCQPPACYPTSTIPAKRDAPSDSFDLGVSQKKAKLWLENL